MFLGTYRQSTAATMLIGPLVDRTDGYTPEQSLTTDGGGLLHYVNGAYLDELDLGTHVNSGTYATALTTTTTATVGVHKLVPALTSSDVRLDSFEFQVVEEAVYDAMYASGATGYVEGPAEQEHVPASRTALINKRLEHEGDPIELTVGDTDLLIAADFAEDLGRGRLASIVSVELDSSVGTTGGITFDSSTGTGVDRTIAKAKVTAVTAGTYGIVWKVTYDGLAGTRTGYTNATVGE